MEGKQICQMWKPLLLNAIGYENFENMQFDHPLQLGTEEYFTQKRLYLTKKVCLSFFARSSPKSVTFCQIRWM